MPKVADISETSPIITKFEIIGLNGFKNLSLKTPTCVRIVVAENGTGKTTLLNALYAVLTRRLSKLYQIKFKKIIIQFEGFEKFEFDRSEIFPTDLKPHNSSAFSEITEYGVTEEELYEFYSEMGQNFDPRKARQHDVYRKIYNNSPYDPAESTRLLRRAMPALERTQVYTGLTSYITKGMADLEVLYLPTFRRIEVEFNKYEKNRNRHLSLFDNMPSEAEENDETLMWFGMGDVEAQLDHIKSTIQSETFTAYSRLSVQSLEDLLSPDTKTPEPIPSDNKNLGDQLRLVLARLGQAEGQAGARILELIETEEINGHAFDSLREGLK